MKEMFKFQFAVLLLFIMTACSAIHLDQSIPHATDPWFGISPEVPLAIKAHSRSEAIKKTADFVGNLRTAEGEELRLLGQEKVPNPLYKKPRIVLYNWITGEQINHGNGRFLMKYRLSTATGTDSLQLYVNHFIRDDLQIPHSLRLAEESVEDHRLASENLNYTQEN